MPLRARGGAARPHAGLQKTQAQVAKLAARAGQIPALAHPPLSAEHRAQWDRTLANVGSLTLMELASVAAVADSNKRAASRARLTFAVKEMAGWMDTSEKAGLGAVHKTIKPIAFAADEFICTRGNPGHQGGSQMDFMKGKRKTWADRWHHDAEHSAEMLRQFQRIRQRAKETELPEIELCKLDSALAAEPNCKSRGLVQICPSL